MPLTEMLLRVCRFAISIHPFSCSGGRSLSSSVQERSLPDVREPDMLGKGHSTISCGACCTHPLDAVDNRSEAPGIARQLAQRASGSFKTESPSNSSTETTYFSSSRRSRRSPPRSVPRLRRVRRQNCGYRRGANCHKMITGARFSVSSGALRTAGRNVTSAGVSDRLSRRATRRRRSRKQPQVSQATATPQG